MQDNILLPPIDLTAGAAHTPMALIRAIVAGYRRYGADPANALAQAHIAPQQLLQEEACVTAGQMELMSLVAMQELDDEALGWFSRRLPWGSYGMLCRASLGAPNLEVALKRWCRHHRLLTEDITLELKVSGGAAALVLRLRQVPDELQEFCQLTCLRYVLGYASWLIDSAIRLQAVRFPFAAPAHAAFYERLFLAPVRFGSAEAALVFDAAYLYLPLRRDEAALRQMLQRALPLTVMRYRRDRLVVQRVRRLLLQLLEESPGSPMTAEAIAAGLHTSARSLHRQLSDEGASLQQLKDEVRRERALHLLHRSQRSIKQIAQAVGFNNEKSFARAFRQWTGMPPSILRETPSAAPAGPRDTEQNFP